LGSAPLGALLAGVMIESLGVLKLLQYSGIASFCAFAATFFTRSLWAIEAEDLSQGMAPSQQRFKSEQTGGDSDV